MKLQQYLGLGINGKASMEEFNQKEIHSCIHSRTPRGWDHQIAQEVIVQYQGYYALNHKLLDFKYFSAYDVWKSSLMLGTFKDQLALGLDFNVALNPDESAGNIYSFSAPSPQRGKNKPKLYVTYGIEGKCVVHDTSLDGTIFRESEYTIDSKPFVFETHAGFTAKIWKLGVNFLYIVRTDEYEGQDEKPNYCRLSFNINF